MAKAASKSLGLTSWNFGRSLRPVLTRRPGLGFALDAATGPAQFGQPLLGPVNALDQRRNIQIDIEARPVDPSAEHLDADVRELSLRRILQALKLLALQH